ncbi:MAG: PEGA domain-containing protein [Candidatus Saccharimonadales bacterium]
MNNHHRMSKRKRQAVLFFTYGFMTLATIAISAVCILLIMGYRFDVSDRTIEQGGLLQFRSTPGGAKVILNDKLLSFTTPGKLDVPVGTHIVKMQREGYHEWVKTTTVKAGELRWLNYARLVPTKIQNKTSLQFNTTVTDAIPTPDRKYVALIGDSGAPILQILDLRNDEAAVPRAIEIPTDQLTLTPGQVSQFTVKEWDFGSRFVMVLHKNGETSEYIRLDRTESDGAARNITKEFNLPFREVHFSGTSGNLMYALTGNDLRKIDTNTGSVSQPLLLGVEQYRLYRENDISFVAVRADKRVAGVYIDEKETIVRSVPIEQALLADLSRYYSRYYLAVTTPEGVDIIKDPAETGESGARKHAQLQRGAIEQTWLDFTSSGRFVVSGNANAYTIYDLETDEHFTVTLQTSLANDVQPRWLDDFHTISTASGEARMVEYDGGNGHVIAKSVTNLPAFLSQDGTFLYSFIDVNGVMTLQSSRLILK